MIGSLTLKTYLANLKAHWVPLAVAFALDLACANTVFVIARGYGWHVASLFAATIFVVEACAVVTAFSLIFDYATDAAPVIFRSDVEEESDVLGTEGHEAESNDVFDEERGEYVETEL